jgi:hypothetical protein
VRLLWEAEESYDALGGAETVRAVTKRAFDLVPREHLRGLDGVYVYDYDPKASRLGVYVRDHLGPRIELFLMPHFLDTQNLTAESRFRVFANHLAHTLFHEVGHHVTLTLNPRRAPSKKRGQVDQTLEKWAEQYVEKRMAKFRESTTVSATNPPSPAAEAPPAEPSPS